MPRPPKIDIDEVLYQLKAKQPTEMIAVDVAHKLIKEIVNLRGKLDRVRKAAR